MPPRENPPHPFALIEAMRSIGYTPATALADLVDNSVSAHATLVKIRVAPPTTEQAGGTATVEDNGKGMTPERLAEAMRWRDYFRLVMEKFGAALFSRNGISARGTRSPQGRDAVTFEKWMSGTTGHRFIDASMRELRLTGFMSNRSRQNVASHFVHDLGMDWRIGAQYFEALLVDYDVYSNWGNWAYVAGVGNDPREHRRFDIAHQAKVYDPQGAYQALWLENDSQNVEPASARIPE